MSDRREQLTPEELDAVLGQYELGTIRQVSEFARGSHAATKLMIVTDSGKFLLKRHSKELGDARRVMFAHNLQRFLASRSFPLPHLVNTRHENSSMLKIGERSYEVFEFIDGETYDKSLPSTHEAGKTLGLYHALVRDFQSSWSPTQSHYHDAESVYEAFPVVGHALEDTSSVAGHKRDLKDVLKKLRSFYVQAVMEVNALGLLDWETQIVHSDWHPGNLLFDAGHVIAVLDHESAQIRPCVTDIANGCLQFSFIAGGRDLSNWKPDTDEARAREFLRGYSEIGRVSELELRAIPFLMQEVVIAQSLPPIIRTSRFASLDGFHFLRTMLEKVYWLRENGHRLTSV